MWSESRQAEAGQSEKEEGGAAVRDKNISGDIGADSELALPAMRIGCAYGNVSRAITPPAVRVAVFGDEGVSGKVRSK